VIAWPEGESFRVTKKVGSKSVRLNIRRDKDWFAANGEVQIDENRVMDLRELLDACARTASWRWATTSSWR
jgi:hypothetical protein